MPPVLPLDEKDSAPRPRSRRPAPDMRTATPMEQLAARSYEHVQFIYSHFFRRLSRDDCADAVQEAFLQAASSGHCAGLDVPRLDAWIKRAAYNKAIDILRGPDRDGRGAVRRQRTDIDALAEVLPSPSVSEDEEDDTAAAVRDAFHRLPALDQRVIGLRHHDNLPREACAELLGMPVTKYKRAHTRAVQRLINLVVQTSPYGESCAKTRTLIDLSSNDLLDEEDVARRDAHIAGCANCRQYHRRSRKLLVLTPLPALGILDRLAARLHGFAERLAFFGGGQATDAVTASSGAGAVAAGGAKLAAVLATGAVAVGGAGAALHDHHVTKQPTAAEARDAPSVPAMRAAPAVHATYAARRDNPPGGTPASGSARSSTSPIHAHSSSTASARTASAPEMKPPGTEVTTTAPAASSATSRPAPRRTLASPSSSSSSATTTAHAEPFGVAIPAAAAADSTTGEFAPHP
jgi:RNA polymerase sigma factor (sigma-70 family)